MLDHTVVLHVVVVVVVAVVVVVLVVFVVDVVVLVIHCVMLDGKIEKREVRNEFFQIYFDQETK